MRITDRFRSEHAVFVEQLRVLATTLRGGTSLDEIVAAIRTLAAPLRRHAQSEEETLFPALGPEADAPIQVLTQEHTQIEGWLQRMAAPQSRAELASLFATFEATLQSHIVREDQVLFPIAERALGDAELVALEEASLGARV